MLGTTPCELTIPELSLLTDMIPALALQYGEKAEAKLDSARTQDELNSARADLEVMRRLLDINQKFLDSLSGNPYGNLASHGRSCSVLMTPAIREHAQFVANPKASVG